MLGVLCGFLFLHLYNIYLFGKKVKMSFSHLFLYLCSGHIETEQTLKSRKYRVCVRRRGIKTYIGGIKYYICMSGVNSRKVSTGGIIKKARYFMYFPYCPLIYYELSKV